MLTCWTCFGTSISAHSEHERECSSATQHFSPFQMPNSSKTHGHQPCRMLRVVARAGEATAGSGYSTWTRTTAAEGGLRRSNTLSDQDARGRRWHTLISYWIRIGSKWIRPGNTVILSISSAPRRNPPIWPGEMKLGLAALRIYAAPPPTSAREGGSPLLLLLPSSRIFHCESSSLSPFSSRSPFRPPVARLAASLENSRRSSIPCGSNEDEEEGEPYLTSSNPSASLLSLSEKPDRSLALLDEYELEELDPDRSTCRNHRSGQFLSLRSSFRFLFGCMRSPSHEIDAFNYLGAAKLNLHWSWYRKFLLLDMFTW